ncbi:kinase-like domain-containing protein [Lasiosphaeria ovina]|uniref:non-specific serine/threonine protein kinase n=1 Tax=Lasiosphaeria ovina TaxID=92902 RepID=A0AAE0JZR9_9PEZI|nr:kinase-like domain-containing protein [Lasiosphaeria ovina]
MNIRRERQKEDIGPQVLEAALTAVTDRILPQILGALDFVHTPIIHRDIKPTNILYQGGKFLLTDFGIAKVVDISRTKVGTEWYATPEVWQNGEQTPKIDIHGLGVTVVECLARLAPEGERQLQGRHQQLQLHLEEHAPPRYASMLAFDADQRPSARGLLVAYFTQPTDGPPHTPQTNVAWTSFGASPMNQANWMAKMSSAAPTPMDWTQTVATAIFPALTTGYNCTAITVTPSGSSVAQSYTRSTSAARS